MVACDPFCPIEFKLSRTQTYISEYFKTHFSPINLLFSPSEAYTRSRNTGVAACGSFCSLNVKLSRNQSWENLCFQTRSSTRFSIKSSRFSMKGSRFSILDSRRNRESSRESRLATDCQLTFERYCNSRFN